MVASASASGEACVHLFSCHPATHAARPAHHVDEPILRPLSPTAPVRIIPHPVAGRERMLQLHKGLRVSAAEFLEPGRELMLTTSPVERLGSPAGASAAAPPTALPPAVAPLSPGPAR